MDGYCMERLVSLHDRVWRMNVAACFCSHFIAAIAHTEYGVEDVHRTRGSGNEGLRRV